MERVLATYSAARRAHVRLFQGLSWLFTPFYQSDSVTLPFIRDRFVALLARVPPVPQLLASMVAGTLVDPFKKIGLREVDWSALEVREQE
jgi:2-polyprenyl-6-methoxyphenol hydroxylase-like FAD-dependent oxidoreductase